MLQYPTAPWPHPVEGIEGACTFCGGAGRIREIDPEKGAHEASCPMCKFCPACARRVPRNKHNCAEARKELK